MHRYHTSIFLAAGGKSTPSCLYKTLCLVKGYLNTVLLTLRGDLRRWQRRTSQHLVEPPGTMSRECD